MSKTKTTATKAKAPKATKGAPQIKKDGKGRFWIVPKDCGKEQGPFETKQATLAAKTGDPAPKVEKAAKGTKPKKPEEPKEKKISAIDAAAQVVSASKEPMNTTELIGAMAKKNLWTSPGGKTPHATLYSAIIREIAAEGKDARFDKTERGKFAAK